MITDKQRKVYEYYLRHPDSLEQRQYRDNVKTEYCQENNIKLIRISYKDFNKINEEYLLDKLSLDKTV